MSHDVGDITGAWDIASLPRNVLVGDGCFLERRESFDRFRSERDPGLVIGDRVLVYTWTTFNVEPSGYVEIGDDSVLVGAVLMCAERIAIGRRVVISYGVTIADSDFHPRDPGLRRKDAVANAPFGIKTMRPSFEVGPVSIQDDAHIGIGAIILKGVTIGAGARVDAGSVVARDVPAGSLATGNPARIVADR